MTFHAHINRFLYRATMISISLLVVSVSVNVWQAFTPKVAARNCNAFGSYAEILDSYRAGNRGLDGNGDGIPCNNRK